MRILVLFFFFSSFIYTQNNLDFTVIKNFNNYQKNVRTVETIQSDYKIGSILALLEDYGETRTLSNAPDLFSQTVESVVFIGTNTGIGAGSIVDKDGHIITNYHVIEGEKESDIKCVLYKDSFINVQNITSRDVLDIEIVGTDKTSDLALLKLKKRISVKPIKMGQAWSVRVAQDVFAIGHPGAYLWYYTSGTINRIAKYSWQYRPDFQVTANIIFTQTPINTGNSGGPLLDEKGRMIGVNSATDSEMQNVNYAIRIDDIKAFIKEAKNGSLSTSTGYKPNNEENKSSDLEWKSIDQNDNGIIDAYVAQVTTDEGNVIKIIKLDEDEDGVIELIIVDSNLDGEVDIIMEDKRGDSSFSYWYTDDDHDGTIDWEGYIDT